jgi:hypothetical protein
MSGRENNDFLKNLLATITLLYFDNVFLATSLLTPQIFLSMAGKWNDEEW